MRRFTFGILVTACLLIGAVPITQATSGTPVQLVVSQSTAFAVLGHSCGGIQEQSIATGFKATTGYPKGFVYVQTRCGGSGRGGGYHVTTYSAWLSVMWGWDASVRKYTVLTGAPAANPSKTYTDAHGDQAYTTFNLTGTCATTISTTCAYHGWLLASAPNAPTGVSVTKATNGYLVSWTPDPNTAAIITGSTITATPDDASAVIVAPVAGKASSATVELAPNTTYNVSVTNTDAAGTSAPSDPFLITTGAATTVPGAPGSLAVKWLNNYPTLDATWAVPAVPGDSPIDLYQVHAAPYDADAGAPPAFDAYVIATSFSQSEDYSYDWAVKVRAHNAAGWGAWSVQVVVVAVN